MIWPDMTISGQGKFWNHTSIGSLAQPTRQGELMLNSLSHSVFWIWHSWPRIATKQCKRTLLTSRKQNEGNVFHWCGRHVYMILHVTLRHLILSIHFELMLHSSQWPGFGRWKRLTPRCTGWASPQDEAQESRGAWGDVISEGVVHQ